MRGWSKILVENYVITCKLPLEDFGPTDVEWLATMSYIEPRAYRVENLLRNTFYKKVPGYGHILPRPGGPWDTPDIGWDDWSPEWLPPFN